MGGGGGSLGSLLVFREEYLPQSPTALLLQSPTALLLQSPAALLLQCRIEGRPDYKEKMVTMKGMREE
jgi:hypothetical protein